jgi:hypothetical protein
MLSSPIFLGVIGFVGILLFIFCGWMVYTWLKGGRGKFSKSQTRYQKCMAVTANFKLAYFNLKIRGNYVFNEITNSWHMLDPDALIPNLATGEYYLPVDERDAIPLFPLRPELRQVKVDELKTNIDSMALANGLQTIHLRQIEKKKEEESGQRNFTLAAAFGILLLIVLGIIAKSFM